jgi:hypothetical protein
MSMENKEINISNEKDLHYKVIDFIKRFRKDAVLVPGLGEHQVNSSLRSDSFYKGYTSGQPDIIILNPHRYYSGLCLELKTPTGKGVVSPNQKEFLNQMEQMNYKVIISNDYDYIIVQLLEYFNDIMYPCKYCYAKRGYKTLEKLNRHYEYFHKIGN